MVVMVARNPLGFVLVAVLVVSLAVRAWRLRSRVTLRGVLLVLLWVLVAATLAREMA